jgi:subtilisin
MFVNKSILTVICSGVVLLLLSNAILSNYASHIFPSALGQQESNKSVVKNSNNRDNSGQTIIDERTGQAPDNANKLRKVAGEKVPNQYIVVLKDRMALTPSTSPSAPSTSASVRAAAEEARNQGATLRHVYEHAIKGYAVRVPNQLVLDRILANPAVDYVQPDIKLKAFSQTLPAGINRVDGDLSATKSGDGTGSVDSDIAILDTGIDTSHPDLNVYKQVTFVSGTSSGNDDNGHGTKVAGVAAAKDDSQGTVGVAPGARLWAVKVLDRNGQGFTSDIMKGVDYVTDHKDEIDTANLSLGGTGTDEALHTAIKNSVAAGVTYVVAAGNDNVDAASQIPASYSEVITVSAIADSDGKCGGQGPSTSYGSDDTLATFSNYGSVVDLAAPGVSIFTTYKGGSYGSSFSGTSASTPFVTGAAALYKSTHSGATPADIRNALLSSGSTTSTVCDGKGHGYFTGDRDSNHEPLLYVGSSTSVDTTLPIVTSTSPAGGATGVAVTTSITATFSEPVKSSSISTSSFILKNSAGSSISGTISFISTDGKTATFKPSSQLAYSTSFTVTISPSTARVQDLAGNAMATKSWSFTTAAAQSQTTSCGSNLPINGATSSGSQSSFPPANAIDNNFNTKWYSTFIVNPWIKADLGSQKSICSVNIAWADGASRQYSFVISGSTDGTSYTNIFSGKSKGTSTSSEKYSFAESPARYVKVTVTQSHVGSTSSIAQISELDIFGKLSTSGVSSSPSVSSHSSQSHSKHPRDSTLNKNAENEVLPTNNRTNSPPVAKDDRLRGAANGPVLVKILGNDFDPDRDKLTIISVTSPTKNGATVTINKNGTVTFLPAPSFAGIDTFTYTISDGRGETDKAKVLVSIKASSERLQEKTGPETAFAKGQQIGVDSGMTDKDNQLRREMHTNNVNPLEIHNGVRSNQSIS